MVPKTSKTTLKMMGLLLSPKIQPPPPPPTLHPPSKQPHPPEQRPVEQHPHQRAPQEPASTKQKPTRVRFSFAKQKLRAPHTFWLKSQFVNPFAARFPRQSTSNPYMMNGRIVSCPAKRNNYMFLIEWEHDEQIPLEWSSTSFTSTQGMKDLL